MLVETKRNNRKGYKDPTIIYQYVTDRKKGLILKKPLYVLEREKTFKLVRQKGTSYFDYKTKTVLKRDETGIILYDDFLKRSYLYLLSDDDNKARELFSEHFENLKATEKKRLEKAQTEYNHNCAKIDCLALIDIREVTK